MTRANGMAAAAARINQTGLPVMRS